MFLEVVYAGLCLFRVSFFVGEVQMNYDYLKIANNTNCIGTQIFGWIYITALTTRKVFQKVRLPLHRQC